MSAPGLDRRDADVALPGQPDAGPAAPPPGKKALTAMLPPKAEPTTGHALIYRPEVPKPKRAPGQAAAEPAAEPADDPFALHITLARPAATPGKRQASPEAVKAIAQEEAAPPAPPVTAAPPSDGDGG